MFTSVRGLFRRICSDGIWVTGQASVAEANDPEEKNPVRPVVTSAGMGSFDFVRLSPHCAQDDKRKHKVPFDFAQGRLWTSLGMTVLEGGATNSARSGLMGTGVQSVNVCTVLSFVRKGGPRAYN